MVENIGLKNEIQQVYNTLTRLLYNEHINLEKQKKFWINDESKNFGYEQNNLYEIARHCAETGVRPTKVENLDECIITLEYSLEALIKVSVFECLDKIEHLSRSQIDYAFYEGHITFKQYNKLVQKRYEYEKYRQ